MKLTNAILATCLATGTAWAQNPSLIGDAKAKLSTVQQQQTGASNAALAATQGQGASPKSPFVPPAKPAQASPAAPKKPVVTVVGAPKNGRPAAKPVTAKAEVKPSVPAKLEEASPAVAVEDTKNPGDSKKDEAKTISMEGRRDPFISPVVNHINTGSGCSTGKRCLAVNQIALTGVVKSDTGMIAVVVNAMNKAYFLRENDPVFNGYVVRITGDSIIFKETFQDNLGKSLTRDVVKKITTPAV
jgi:Tfp pilus assembly protein PilP